jgi:hypothetical protein
MALRGDPSRPVYFVPASLEGKYNVGSYLIRLLIA